MNRQRIFKATVLFIFPALLTASAPRLSAAEAKYGPILQFDSEHLDLGRIKQGQTPHGHFTLRNIGDQTLEIREIKPSCGCTAIMAESKSIPPGQESKLQVSVDTTGKEAEIEKTILVVSNDSMRPRVTLTVSLLVEPGEHPDFDIGESLFSPRCASCHVDSGKGLKGRALFQAICYQCHGENGEGKSAAALNGREYLQQHDDQYLFNWIARGKRGTAMAGYGEEYGGFLSKEQIDSLIKFLRQPPLPGQDK